MYCFQDYFSQLIWVLLGSRRGPMLCNCGTSMVRSPECVPCRTFLRHWKISIKSTIFTIAIKNQRTLPCRQGPKLRDCICKMRLQNIDISQCLWGTVGCLMCQLSVNWGSNPTSFQSRPSGPGTKWSRALGCAAEPWNEPKVTRRSQFHHQVNHGKPTWCAGEIPAFISIQVIKFIIPSGKLT